MCRAVVCVGMTKILIIEGVGVKRCNSFYNLVVLDSDLHDTTDICN